MHVGLGARGVGVAEARSEARVVVTGAGGFDAPSMRGKLTGEVIFAAAAYGKPVGLLAPKATDVRRARATSCNVCFACRLHRAPLSSWCFLIEGFHFSPGTQRWFPYQHGKVGFARQTAGLCFSVL